jgi:hypothetical protein
MCAAIAGKRPGRTRKSAVDRSFVPKCGQKSWKCIATLHTRLNGRAAFSRPDYRSDENENSSSASGTASAWREIGPRIRGDTNQPLNVQSIGVIVACALLNTLHLHKYYEASPTSLILALAGFLLGTAPKAAAFPATKDSAIATLTFNLPPY